MQQEERQRLRESIDRAHEKAISNKLLELASGRKIILGCHDLAVLSFLRGLKPRDRIELLGITEQDAADFIAWKYVSRRQKALEYLTANVHWRETGEPYAFEDVEVNGYLFGIGLERAKLISKIKRGTMPAADIDRIIDAFECPNPDLYIKEDFTKGIQTSMGFGR